MTGTPEPEVLFGQRMRRRRDELGISLRDLADRMQQQGHQWHRNTVSRTEAAERPVRLNEAVALAGILRMPLVELLAPNRTDESTLREHITVLKYQIDEVREAITHTRRAQDEAQRKQASFTVALRDAERAEAKVTSRIAELTGHLDALNAQYSSLSAQLASVVDTDVPDKADAPDHAVAVARTELMEHMLTRAEELGDDATELIKLVFEQGIPSSREWRRHVEDILLWVPGSVDAIVAGGEPTPTRFQISTGEDGGLRVSVADESGAVVTTRDTYRTPMGAIRASRSLLAGKEPKTEG